jgi:hypothetical protein
MLGWSLRRLAFAVTRPNLPMTLANLLTAFEGAVGTSSGLHDKVKAAILRPRRPGASDRHSRRRSLTSLLPAPEDRSNGTATH